MHRVKLNVISDLLYFMTLNHLFKIFRVGTIDFSCFRKLLRYENGLFYLTDLMTEQVPLIQWRIIIFLFQTGCVTKHTFFNILLRFRNGKIFRAVRPTDKLKSYGNSLAGYLKMSVLLTGTIPRPLQKSN